MADPLLAVVEVLRAHRRHVVLGVEGCACGWEEPLLAHRDGVTDHARHVAEQLTAAGVPADPLHEVQCPACSATIRARMADAPAPDGTTTGSRMGPITEWFLPSDAMVQQLSADLDDRALRWWTRADHSGGSWDVNAREVIAWVHARIPESPPAAPSPGTLLAAWRTIEQLVGREHCTPDSTIDRVRWLAARAAAGGDA